MSLKTEPKGIPLKNGDCLDCGGLGFTGMYHSTRWSGNEKRKMGA